MKLLLKAISKAIENNEPLTSWIKQNAKILKQKKVHDSNLSENDEKPASVPASDQTTSCWFAAEISKKSTSHRSKEKSFQRNCDTITIPDSTELL